MKKLITVTDKKVCVSFLASFVNSITHFFWRTNKIIIASATAAEKQIRGLKIWFGFKMCGFPLGLIPTTKN